MTPDATRHAPAILGHMLKDPRLATLPLSVRGVWLQLSLAMLDRKHTAYGVTGEPERLAEIVVCPLAELNAAVGVLLDERLLEWSADTYLRSPFVTALMRPASAR
ncbi:MAG: hypothetical protein JWR10_3423 [Rubritepida sp.]|nr:hypothetical protein [Rubritepida sp.]